MKKIITIALSSIVLGSISFAQTPKSSTKDLPKGLYANIETSKGDILVFLEFQRAPLTVSNFVGLAEGKIHNDAKPDGTPYYDGLNFHRVVPDFVIQGGDPNGNGEGGPGYDFKDEFHSDLKHDKAGILAMANAGPNTNGSQFYITLGPKPFLDGKYNVFGHVVQGQDVVSAIKQGDKINQVKIIRVGKEAKKFKADKVFKQYEADGAVQRSKK